jgi:hypothetical protein
LANSDTATSNRIDVSASKASTNSAVYSNRYGAASSRFNRSFGRD